MLTSQNAALVPFGLHPSGDWGPYTLYTTKKRKVVSFLRAPPKDPPSPAQRRQRELWSAIANQWRSLPQTTRDAWYQATRRAHLHVTPFNVYLYFFSTGDLPCLQTISNQSGIPLSTLL